MMGDDAASDSGDEDDQEHFCDDGACHTGGCTSGAQDVDGHTGRHVYAVDDGGGHGDGSCH